MISRWSGACAASGRSGSFSPDPAGPAPRAAAVLVEDAPPGTYPARPVAYGVASTTTRALAVFVYGRPSSSVVPAVTRFVWLMSHELLLIRPTNWHV